MVEKELLALMRKLKALTSPTRDWEVWTCRRCELRHKGTSVRCGLLIECSNRYGSECSNCNRRRRYSNDRGARCRNCESLHDPLDSTRALLRRNLLAWGAKPHQAEPPSTSSDAPRFHNFASSNRWFLMRENSKNLDRLETCCQTGPRLLLLLLCTTVFW